IRAAANAWPDFEFDQRLAQNLARMQQHAARGDALLFLQGSGPHLMDGISPERVAALRQRCCEHYGRVAPRLVGGDTNWTIAPAPTEEWARAVFEESSDAANLARLWREVFNACRVTTSDPLATWRAHLESLQAARDELNTR